MLKKILLLVLVLIAAFAAFVAMQPAEYSVSRKATIPGSPAAAFAVVNNLHEFNKWSPWSKLDPNMQTTYGGPDSGEGATYEWQGNSDVGKGKMTITESKPNDHVGIRLEFIEPFPSVNQTDFYFKPVGDATEVTWSLNGKNGFIEKAFGLFVDVEGMIGTDFEKGLDQLSAVVKAMPTEEPEPAAEASTSKP